MKYSNSERVHELSLNDLSRAESSGYVFEFECDVTVFPFLQEVEDVTNPEDSSAPTRPLCEPLIQIGQACSAFL